MLQCFLSSCTLHTTAIIHVNTAVESHLPDSAAICNVGLHILNTKMTASFIEQLLSITIDTIGSKYPEAVVLA